MISDLRVNKNSKTTKNTEDKANIKEIGTHKSNMNHRPKTSIIIPVYNTEKYLRECLDSIINQTLKDIEIICVDDGSTDGSFEILKEYAQKDKRFIILKQENSGAGEARNAGFRLSKGDFVYFMDSDDFLIPQKLSKIVSLMENAKEYYDFCIFGYMTIDNNTKQTVTYNLNKFFDKNENSHIKQATFEKDYTTLINSSVVPWNKVYRRKFLLKNNLIFDNLKCANDRSFYFNSIFKSKNILLFNKPIIYHRTNVANSLVKKRAQNFSCMYKVYFDVMKNNNLQGTKFEDLFKRITLNDAFYWYSVCTISEQKRIKNSLKKFVKQLYTKKEIKKIHSQAFWYYQCLDLLQPKKQILFGKFFKLINCYLR